jgi:hypothetical protein
MSGSPDLELLRWAARENRILITHDKKTMSRWVKHCLKRREKIAGVIIVPKRMAVGRVISDLELMLECFSPAELTGQIKYLPL